MNLSSKWLLRIWTWFHSKGWLLRRFGEGILFLWIISLVSFAIVQVAPGDAAMSLLRIDTVAVTVEQVEALRQEMGLNDPIHQNYVHYMNNLLHLDLGKSIMTGRSVASELSREFSGNLFADGHFPRFDGGFGGDLWSFGRSICRELDG